MSTFRFSGNRRWIAIGGAVVAVLVVVGLLLPPVSVLERTGIVCTGTTLNADSPAVTTPAGLTVALSDTSRPLTFKTNVVEQAQYETGQAGEDLSAAQASQPAQIVLRSPVYQLNACGQDPVSASIAVALPAGAQSDQTYDLYGWDGKTWSWLGAYVDPASGTVSAQVEALPKNVALFQSTSTAPAVSAQVRPGQKLPAGAADNLTEAYIVGWTVADDGAIVATAGDLPDTGKAKLYPVVQSMEAAPVQNILASEDSITAHLDRLSELAARKNFAGLAVDYRGLPAEDRAAFTKFVKALADRLHAENKLLAVVLPAPAIDQNGAPDTAGYDWVAIGQAADIVQADFGQDPANYLSGKAGYALVDWAPTQIDRYKFQPIYSVASLATQDGQTVEVPFAEAIKPIGQFTLTEPISITPGSPITLTLANPTQVSDFGYDDTTHTYRFKYMNNGKPREVVVKTARTLAHQLELLLPRHMRGAVITGLEGDVEPASLAQALKGYRQQAVPQGLPTPFDVQWKIALSNGKTITITRPITDTTYVWTAPDQTGDLKIVALVGSQPHGESKLSITADLTATESITATAGLTTTGTTTTTVAGTVCLSSSFVADVTIPDGTQLKNSETFTKTWRINNNGQCNWPDDTALVFVSGTKLGSPDTIQVGKVVSGTQKDISVQLQAPDQYGNYTGLWQLRSGQTNFGTQMSAVIVAGEPPAGGNITAGTNAPPVVSGGTSGGFEIGGQINGAPFGPMKRAGMKWIKVQSQGGDESGAINMAHSNGFKILLSVLGDHGRVMDPGYQDSYAADVAKMAAAGADAIEVWNEPNIDREWPNGQISGSNYTQLLAKAYNAIKAANSGTMVISAAPAPTGFFSGGCQAAGCNDDAFLGQMAAAGAAKYMDCVGAHHNSGTTSPSVSSGRPEGNHYSWYFLPTLNLYYSAFGGARKVCFTELGYLTPQGYPSLSSTAPSFAWAENTTIAQQAQWLAEAASISGNSGKVRLMIVFNVDFDYYGSDPQAGYAIIRKDGSCPACDALGAVVGSR
ncbi:MAG TPA: NBR1-Ig-like domain-containing protein [Anaerolineae bacterium]|nr:NBR1-Ig-like domain-containing protein [Anaerolineae bacterium]